MNYEYQTVVLAGLLHDFGKFLTRPESKTQSKSEWKKPHQRGVEYWQAYRDQLQAKSGIDVDLLLALLDESENAKSNLRWWLVKMADGCVSGEREQALSSDEAPKSPQALPAAHYTTDTIFARVDLKRANLPKQIHRYRHLVLKPNRETIFPWREKLPEGDEKARIVQDIQTIKDLLDKAVQDLLKALPDPTDNAVRQSNTTRLIVTLTSLLQNHLWAFPDDVLQEREAERRDISLYDHSRLVSAAAACLYVYHDAMGTLGDADKIKNREEKKFLLVGGDLSGIQNYLYEIATIGAGGGVAKRLRARSFYLTALVEVIAQRALRELVPDVHLPHTCQIFSAGGRFTLLAPNTDAVRANLVQLEAQVNDWLVREFQGELSFTFASLELAGNDFKVERHKPPEETRITKKLTELDDLLAKHKARKLQTVLTDNGAWVEARFTSAWEGQAKLGDCASCRKFPARDGNLCPHCQKDKAFGSQLAAAGWVVYSAGKIPDGDNVLGFFDGAYSVQVYADHALPSTFAVPPLLVEKINPFPYDLHKVTAPVREHFIANYVPRDGNEILDFEEIAKRSDGEPLLGVLKADVDRLGMIFSLGLENASLSRLATLSRMVDLFFGGWVHERLFKNFKNCYTVYSGGDDLLIVGPWTEIVNLAQVLAEDWHEYTGRNPNVTLSAGIAVTKPKFPIAKSSKLVDEMLKEAKKKRNALHLFGVTVEWGNALNELLGKSEATVSPSPEIDPSPADAKAGYGVFLYRQSQQGGDLHGKRGFLHRLVRYSTMCARYFDPHAKQSNPRDLLYSSHLVYDLARNVKRMDGNKITNEEVVNKLAHLAHPDGKATMQNLRLPLTWALLKLRGKDNDGKS